MSLLVLLSFSCSFDYCIICPFICDLWLSIWYRQSFHQYDSQYLSHCL